MRAYLTQISGLRREIKLFLIYNLFANIGIGVFTLIFNLYLIQLSLQEDFIGLYNGVTTVAMGVVGLVMGVLINRYGSWRCIFFGTWVFLISSVGLSLLDAPISILGLAIAAGAGTAFVFVPVMPFIVEYAQSENRSTAAALVFSVTSLSVTFGSLVGGWSPRLFATLLDLELGGVMAYRLSLLLGLALAGLSLIPLWLMRDARHGHESSDTGQFAVVTELPATRHRVRRDIVVFVATGVLLSLGAGAVIPFYNVFLQSIGARPSQIGMIFALASLVAALTGLLAPAMSRRFGPLPAVFILRMTPIPLYALLAFVPNLNIGIVAHIVRTTTISMAWPIDSTFIADVLPGKARATAFSIRSGAWNLGVALSSLIAGQVIVQLGYGATFIVFAFFSAASAVLFFGYFRRHPSVSAKPLANTRQAPAS